MILAIIEDNASTSLYKDKNIVQHSLFAKQHKLIKGSKIYYLVIY